MKYLMVALLLPMILLTGCASYTAVVVGRYQDTDGTYHLKIKQTNNGTTVYTEPQCSHFDYHTVATGAFRTYSRPLYSWE